MKFNIRRNEKIFGPSTIPQKQLSPKQILEAITHGPQIFGAPSKNDFINTIRHFRKSP
jgi:hypothetical protein